MCACVCVHVCVCVCVQPLITSEWSYHTARVNSVSWAPDSSRLASGSLDTNAIVWSPANKNNYTVVKGSYMQLPFTDWNSIHYLNLTLPYHTGKTFYRLALRPLTGPMRIPELTVRLQNPQVQYSPGSIPIPGTILLQERAYSLEPTY